MIRRLQHAFMTAVLAAALLPMGAAAIPADTTDASEQETIEKMKILRLLNSDAVEDQERAIRLIGTYAHAGRYDEDFYRVMIRPLHYIVARGETEALRIMAVSALALIGSNEAIAGLQAQVDAIDSPRVQRLARFALAYHRLNRPLQQQGSGQP